MESVVSIHLRGLDPRPYRNVDYSGSRENSLRFVLSVSTYIRCRCMKTACT